jgi:hypothetical protein
MGMEEGVLDVGLYVKVCAFTWKHGFPRWKKKIQENL